METSTNLNQATIDELKSLVTANANSASIFREAGELAKDRRLTDLFADVARTRESNASALQEGLALSGEFEEASTNLVEPLQRWWMKARDVIQSEEGVGLLSELERSEDRILHAYEDALRKTAGSPLNATLLSQLAAVKRHHDVVRDLRDVAKERA